MIFSNARLVLLDGIRDGLEMVVENGKISRDSQTIERGSDRSGGKLSRAGIHRSSRSRRGRPRHDGGVAGSVSGHLRLSRHRRHDFAAVDDRDGADSGRLSTCCARCGSLPRMNSSKSPACTWRGHSSRESAARSATRGIHRDPGAADRCSSCSNLRMSSNASRLRPNLPGALEVIDRLREREYRGQRRSQRRLGRGGARRRSSTGCGMSPTRSIACHRCIDGTGSGWRACSNLRSSEPEIMCELIADGHHVSNTLMKMLYRAKGREGHLPGDRCDGGRRVCRRARGFHSGGRRLHGERWGLLAGRSFGSGRERVPHDRSCSRARE